MQSTTAAFATGAAAAPSPGAAGAMGLEFTRVLDRMQAMMDSQAVAVADLSAKIAGMGGGSAASTTESALRGGSGEHIACPVFSLADFGGSLPLDLVKRAASKYGIAEAIDAIDRVPGLLGAGSFASVVPGSLFDGAVPTAVKVCVWV